MFLSVMEVGLLLWLVVIMVVELLEGLCVEDLCWLVLFLVVGVLDLRVWNDFVLVEVWCDFV